MFALFFFYYFFVLLFWDEIRWWLITNDLKNPWGVCFFVNKRWVLNDWFIERNKFAFGRSVDFSGCFNTLDGYDSSPLFKTFADSWMLDMHNFAKLALSVISNADSVSIALKAFDPLVALGVLDS